MAAVANKQTPKQLHLLAVSLGGAQAIAAAGYTPESMRAVLGKQIAALKGRGVSVTPFALQHDEHRDVEAVKNGVRDRLRQDPFDGVVVAHTLRTQPGLGWLFGAVVNAVLEEGSTRDKPLEGLVFPESPERLEEAVVEAFHL